MSLSNIRNFCIIAHVDHGKSTLADRIIERCSINDRPLSKAQVLDSMDLERERGITIKAQAVRLNYKNYQFHLIDTPGHVDFSYEVSRSFYASDGVILLVDATQGIEAQTISVYREAKKANLKIIPVLNKVDLAQANIEEVGASLHLLMEDSSLDILSISAKSGLGVGALLDAIVQYIPAPKLSSSNYVQALVIDAWFNNYIGVVFLVCVKSGALHVRDQVQFMSMKKRATIEKLGVFIPEKLFLDTLHLGEVGFLITDLRDARYACVGDTITLVKNPSIHPLESFSPPQPQVFVGFFQWKSQNIMQ